MNTPLERIAAALERIAGNMDAAKVLEERRRRKAARQARYRASRNAVASTVDATERNEEAKEGKSPHTPLKGESEEAKKELPSPRAHAREFVPPTVDEVTAYCRERRSTVDPVQHALEHRLGLVAFAEDGGELGAAIPLVGLARPGIGLPEAFEKGVEPVLARAPALGGVFLFFFAFSL